MRSWTGDKVGAMAARNLHKNEGRERVTLWGFRINEMLQPNRVVLEPSVHG
jgi:hypothetical protein